MNPEKTNEIIGLLEVFEKDGIHYTGKALENVLRFQDLIGGSSKTEINEFEENLNQNNRRLFIWATGVCLDKDTFVEIIKYTVCQRYIEKAIGSAEKDFNDRWNKLFTEKKNLNKE